MDVYERDFLVKATRVCKAGIRLEDLAREALTAKFGGAADVMLGGLSVETLSDPKLFVGAMSRIFGRGAMGIYEPIVKYVDLGLYGGQQSSPVLDLIRQLGPASTSEVTRTVPLHDQRVKDDEGNYADDAG